MPKIVNLRVFESLELAVKQFRQFFMGQKLVENAKKKKLKCDILVDFQTALIVDYCALKIKV